jgi:6-phosphofructokinase 1
MVIELMGHTAGWLALYAGMAGGGDVILLPELGYDFQVVNRYLLDRAYKKKPYSIVVVAEGVEKPEEEPSAAGYVAKMIEKGTRIETRTTILGYVQRGGSPSPMDRILATRFGTKAVDLIAQEKYGRMVNIVNNSTDSISLSEVAGKLNLVPKKHSLINKARALDICMGDECHFS